MAAISCFDSIPVDKTNNMFYPLILFRRSPEYLDMDVCLFFLTSAFSQTGQMRSPRDSLKRHQNIFDVLVHCCSQGSGSCFCS